MATWSAEAAQRGKRKARARLISDPGQSDRTIAQYAGVHHKTVGRLRRRLELEEVVPIFRRRGAARRVVIAPRADLIGIFAYHGPRGSRPGELTSDERDGLLCRVSLVFEYADEEVPAGVRSDTNAHDIWFKAHSREDWLGSFHFPTRVLLDSETLQSELQRSLPRVALSVIRTFEHRRLSQLRPNSAG